MKAINFLFLLSVVLASVDIRGEGRPEKADEAQKSSVLEQLQGIDELNPRDWGIRNGCISMSRVRSIDFVDDQKALISLSGKKKKALLTLRRECRGIESNGFVHQSRSGDICARFDSLKVIRSGFTCQIESIEPYVELEEPSPEKDGNEN